MISDPADPRITSDNLEIAQFLYLLLNNRKIRDVIDTITSKVVLILGRFSDERKAVLDALRSELRQRDYLPVIFDFDQPASRDIMETVSTIAHLSRFLIADITDAKSIPQELMAIVPDLPSVPVPRCSSNLPRSARCSASFGVFRGCSNRSSILTWPLSWVLSAKRSSRPPNRSFVNISAAPSRSPRHLACGEFEER